jgi:hypothetical protein
MRGNKETQGSLKPTCWELHYRVNRESDFRETARNGQLHVMAAAGSTWRGQREHLIARSAPQSEAEQLDQGESIACSVDTDGEPSGAETAFIPTIGELHGPGLVVGY